MTKTKKRIAVLLAFLLVVVLCAGVLHIGCLYTQKSFRRWQPSYERVEISALLDKSILTDEEYELLYRQTGLTRLAIEDMRKNEVGKKKIVEIQTALFAPYKVKSRRIRSLTYVEEIDATSVLCDVKDGDIIVTSTTRVSWWRYGHAAIVVNGEQNLIAECFGPGEKSKLSHVNAFNERANFLILRPKVEEEKKTEIVEYVKEELLGVDYRFTTGIFSKKYAKNLKKTQCAHFVWYAYKKFGIDLDSNGGKIVKPRDIATSPKVELVQAFGFDLDKLWS